jgi:hypothetical protein
LPADATIRAVPAAVRLLLAFHLEAERDKEAAMPYWAWILIVVGLSLFAIAIFYWALHLAHRSIPARQTAQGDPETDISAPISLDVAHADDQLEGSDAMTAREIEPERERETQPSSVRNRVATYEIAQSREANAPAAVVGDLPRQRLERSSSTWGNSGALTRSSQRTARRPKAGWS